MRRRSRISRAVAATLVAAGICCCPPLRAAPSLAPSLNTPGSGGVWTAPLARCLSGAGLESFRAPERFAAGSILARLNSQEFHPGLRRRALDAVLDRLDASPLPALESEQERLIADAVLTAAQGNREPDLDAVFQPAANPKAKRSLDRLLELGTPSVVAHGKNDYAEVAGQSTWGNLGFSVAAVGGRPIVLEADIRRVGDRLVVFHDATFHARVRDYRTSPAKVEQFRREHPELARTREGRWDFYLFDGVETHATRELDSGIRIFDPPTGLEYPLIGLGELLRSVETPGRFRIPEHAFSARGPPSVSGLLPARALAAGPAALYLDLKEINHLPRRLYGLPDWHWIIETWSTERIEALTRHSLEALSAALHAAGAHDRAFIAVRHPRVAALAREIDPKIRLMASPDDVGPATGAGSWARAMDAFLAFSPELIEIKFLAHMREPAIRAWAREHGLAILYDFIPQTDLSQFEGVYRGRPELVFAQLLEHGTDILIQTNSPGDLQSLIDRR